MREPLPSRPHWPDALEKTPAGDAGLKHWSWALERLEKSHNYWIATSRPDGRPHLMVVWGIWWKMLSGSPPARALAKRKTLRHARTL